ncbi:MAG: DUF1385 domain-containing protein [Actinobacteria bacterium]|nr:DUF1385 domain-containing protein [Actinomycetota bacterium]
MMRGRNCWGVAVRRPSGGIARTAYPLDPPGSSHRILRFPVIRGVVALYESLSLGIKALGISANIGLEEATVPEHAAPVSPELVGAAAVSSEAVGSPTVTEGTAVTPVAAPGSATDTVPTPGSGSFGFKELAVTVFVSAAMAVALFVVVPLVVVKQFESTFSNPFLFNLVEGLIRIAIFLLYIVGISLIPDLRRVFQYHGAEHKVIHAYEACGKPDAEEAGKYSTLHPRCGTGFLLLVMVIAVFLFAIVGKPTLPYLVLSRIVGIPVIVGIAYEVGIKWAGRHPHGPFARVLLWPGLQLQRLTTREPTGEQLEVAAAALEEVMAMDASRQAVAETVPAMS